MDLIDSATSVLGGRVHAALGDGALASLVADGVIAGVGSVIIFLPQIMILFLFIILLEDDPRFNAGTGSRVRIDGRITSYNVCYTKLLRCLLRVT